MLRAAPKLKRVYVLYLQSSMQHDIQDTAAVTE